MPQRRLPRIALMWEQFAPYHIDRIEAAAARLADQAEVIGVEVATASQTYAWPPSGAVRGATKCTLFPGQTYEAVGAWRRFRKQLHATWGCRLVLVGISYNRPDVLLLAWLLRLTGHQVVMMSDSKYDDRQRSVWIELGKSLLLRCFSAAVVAGHRQAAYFRFLGFDNRPILQGYDTVSAARIRAEAAAPASTPIRFEDRAFLFVGRFVPKKNLLRLIEAYAAYAATTGAAARRLRLVGSGELEAAIRFRCAELGIADRVDFTGFLDSAEIAAEMRDAAALLLVSTEEQWGLVVNEAISLGTPVIISSTVGAHDLLVRNLLNGVVVEADSTQSIAAAMVHIGSDQARWQQLSDGSSTLTWFSDTERFADAVQQLLAPDQEPAKSNIARYRTDLPVPEMAVQPITAQQ